MNNKVQMDNLFNKLSKSKFRSSFHLKQKDIEYINKIGMEKLKSHAAEFIKHRIAPKDIKNDGKQTPMKGHPVFIAQHATATCCRGCLYKWYGIKKGYALTKAQQEYFVNVIMLYINKEIERNK